MAVTYRVPGAVLTERSHPVPLDHSKPDGDKITIFTRELAAPDGLDRPYLLFLQGGQALRRRDPPHHHRGGRNGRSPTTGCCSSTSAAPVAPPRSATSPAQHRRNR